jgi:hypothetical protein
MSAGSRPRALSLLRCSTRRLAVAAGGALYAVAVSAAAAPPPAADAEAAPALRIEQGRISADVGTVPIASILAQVARATGATVLVRGDLGLTRPQSFRAAPLFDGLERLVAPNHLLVEYAAGRDDLPPRIARIRVFGAGAANDPSPEPLAIGAATTPAATIAGSSVGAGRFSGKLGWSYDDPDKLPSLPVRVRQIGTIYASSGTDGLAALTEIIESDPDTPARVAAVRALVQFPVEDVYGLVQQALADSSPEVRLAGVAAIDPHASEPMLNLVEFVVDESEDQRVRLAAIERLAGYQASDDVRQALNEAAGAEDAKVRAAARAVLQR